MGLAKLDITLDIQNNTNYPQEISVLGNPYNPLDTVNATREFRWNLTGFTFTNETNVAVQYRANADTTFITFVAGLPTPTLQGLTVALNTLGIGFFNLYTELGQTYIGTYNQNYVFGGLNVYLPTLLNPNFFSGTGFNGDLFVVSNNYVGGAPFNDYNGTTIGQYISSLNNDGSLNTTFNTGTGFDGIVNAIAVQSDGKIVVGGDFTNYNGNIAGRIARLNIDGSIDLTFVGSFDDVVNTIAIQSDGKILVGGNYFSYNSTPANSIIRLDINGNIDASFIYGTGFSSYVNTIVLQSNGKILLGGGFTSYNGNPANYIVRLNTNGSIDGTFDATQITSGAYVTTIAVESNGKILVGGLIADYSGQPILYFVRINADGSLDLTSYTGIGFDTLPTTMLIQQNNKIIIGGVFTTYGTTTTNYIVRLNPDLSIDTTWNIGSGFDSNVNSISYLNGTTSSILVGGAFTTFDGQMANRIANLIL